MDTTSTHRTPTNRAVGEMSAYEFASLGVTQVIYVRPAQMVALPVCETPISQTQNFAENRGYAVFASDGTFLQLVPTMEEVVAVAAQHELEIAALH